MKPRMTVCTDKDISIKLGSIQAEIDTSYKQLLLNDKSTGYGTTLEPTLRLKVNDCEYNATMSFIFTCTTAPREIIELTVCADKETPPTSGKVIYYFTTIEYHSTLERWVCGENTIKLTTDNSTGANPYYQLSRQKRLENLGLV